MIPRKHLNAVSSNSKPATARIRRRSAALAGVVHHRECVPRLVLNNRHEGRKKKVWCRWWHKYNVMFSFIGLQVFVATIGVVFHHIETTPPM
jgi:hypothetical protein